MDAIGINTAHPASLLESQRELAIDCLAGAALLIAVDSARRHRPWRMTIATIVTMSALLWYWREMVRFYDTRGRGRAQS